MNINNPTTFSVPDLTLGLSNSSGSAGALRADDTILVYDTTLPDAITYGQSGSAGSAATAARRDHAHAMAATATSISTGTYTGDGETSNGIAAGLTGAQVKFCMVQASVSSTGGVINRGFIFTSDTIVDDITAGCSLNLWNTEEPEWGSNGIIALGSNSFTVDDAGGDAHPNKDGYTYNFLCWGNA